MPNDREIPTTSGADVGLTGEQQIRLALAEIVRRGGTAASSDLYEPIERHMNGVKLSKNGKAAVRYFINKVAVDRGLVFAHDPTMPGWRITDAGRRYLQDSVRTDTQPPLRIVPIHNQPFLPTQLWLDPGGPDTSDVVISTQPSLDPAMDRLGDLKAWTLGGDPERPIPTSDPRRSKKIHRDRVLRSFLDQLFDVAPRRFMAARELYFLLPDVPTEAARAHRRLLSRVARELWPQLPVRFLREAEMAFEYVRLIRGELDYTPGDPAIYLVIDCGARHCTFSALYTPPGATKPELRALPGVSVGITGSTVDTNLLTDARSQLGLGKDDTTLDPRVIEYAKLRVARSNRPFALHGPSDRGAREPIVRAWRLQPKRLRHLGGSIVGRFGPPPPPHVATGAGGRLPPKHHERRPRQRLRAVGLAAGAGPAPGVGAGEVLHW